MKTEEERELLGAMPRSLLDAHRRSGDEAARQLVAEVDRLREIERRQDQMLADMAAKLRERQQRDFERESLLMGYEAAAAVWPLPDYLRKGLPKT